MRSTHIRKLSTVRVKYSQTSDLQLQGNFRSPYSLRQRTQIVTFWIDDNQGHIVS